MFSSLSTLSFLTPLALALAALAIPIILLYMLRLRRTEMQVSSTFLWQQLVRDREANAPWQKLRFSWLLILQLLILAALVLALARPFVEVKTITTGRIVLLLDASASMTATDVEPSRFAAAREVALSIVDTLGPDDTMTVIRVGDVPEVLAAASRDRLVLRDAIESAEAGAVSADWQAALTLAASGGVGVDALKVVLVSDGGLPADLPPIPGDLRFVPVGRSSANLAISALAVGSLPGDSPQLFMRITNYGDAAMDVIADLRLDGSQSIYWAYRYTVPAQGHVDINDVALPEDFETLTAALTLPAGTRERDYLGVDDVAYAVRDQSGAARVLLVMQGENLFLRQIFRSLPGVQLAEAQSQDSLPQQPFDLYVFDGWLPGTLPDGDLLLVNPPQSTDFFTIGAAQAASDGVSVNSDDPRMQNVAPYADGITLRQVRPLSGIGWATVLVRADGQPIIVAGERDNQQIALLGFDARYPNTDLVLQPAWPILVAELVSWFSPARAIDASESLSPGIPVTVRFVENANRATIVRPNGAQTTIDAVASTAVYADTLESGVYRVTLYADDQPVQSEPFAVNLFDAAESKIAPVSSVTIGTTTITQAVRQETGRREWWPWIAGLGLLLLLVEWWLYHRTRQRLPRATLSGGSTTTPGLIERIRSLRLRRKRRVAPVRRGLVARRRAR
ncbi:vWA domain-containing protein [Aggregatilinea lenta]|uniref:vWA domain-containing protein n=1 Tax=Aggregatilinea lenta TaxID=913108 RepID=UPI000E5A5F0A|nr:VWA domain-containing protein [Aggregatilinea lenta]